ncbi:hypothetical protein DFH07DRAFT_326915 [Mycena maculata]|uniref:DUF1254 domain-containing protein n=1 Tax=Mycena maculata TaxID=230809 RepID=A0AAD7JLI1_9AGAR|nr:hypothetical protein DFH07DRAFT_326915 [Mycena maculata]
MRQFLFPLSLALLVAPSYSLFSSGRDILSEQDATIAALVYGIPLTSYVVWANAVAAEKGGWFTNSFYYQPTLANASSPHVVILPNVDTLYSGAMIDLSQGDVVATMPPLEEGRFYVWPFYDLYGDNFCNIGTATNSLAGKYLIKYRASEPGCVAGSDEYTGIIYMPTVYGATLLRIEVFNSSDVNYVASSIDPGFRLSVLPSDSAPRAPALTQELLNDNLNTSDPALYIMQLTARVAAFNMPEVPEDVAPIAAVLEIAGISMTAQTYTMPAGVNLTLAYSAAQDVLLGVVANQTNFVALGNSWMMLAPALCGNFLSHYGVRAFIAMQAYLQLQASEAVYPTFALSGNLYANQTYMVQFFGKPQVNGFWSLTVYDGEGYLVPNSINRYSLNNRDNMTYPDGTLVYGGSSPANSTQSFYMLLQSTDTPASAEWESNWLPTPAAGGEFSFQLRWYGPTDSLLNGTYTYPKLTAVAANPPLPISG